MMYGSAEISMAEGGDVAAATGPTYSESVDIAQKTLAKEQAYQERRLRLLCAPTRVVSAQSAMKASKGMMQSLDKSKVMKYALIGLIGYLAYKGLRK